MDRGCLESIPRAKVALPSPDPSHSLHFNALVTIWVPISARFSTGPGEVAQLAEHAAENRGVGSSILPLATRRERATLS
jgi:hypothetical protein